MVSPVRRLVKLSPLVSNGVLPSRRVLESLKLAELTLTVNASSPSEYENNLLFGTGIVALYYLAPIEMTATLVAIYGFCSVANYRDARLAREAIRRYILESLDAYETIRTGQVRDLGQTLDEHFGDSQQPEHYQKL